MPSLRRVASTESPVNCTLSSAAVRAPTSIFWIFATADASATDAAFAFGTSLSDLSVTSPAPTWISGSGFDQSTLTGKFTPSAPSATRAATALSMYGCNGGNASPSMASLRSAVFAASVKPPDAFSVPLVSSAVLSV